MQTANKWSDVKQYIHNQILNKTFIPGDKLPKDSEFAERLQCARTTVQRAMQELADMGIVKRTRKGGTFVSPFQRTHANIDIPIIQQEIESMGYTYTYHCIHREIAKMPKPLIHHWGMHKVDDMLHVQCVHMGDDMPYIYEDRWINTHITADILRVDLHLQSANAWLIKNRPYTHISMEISAVNADSATAHILHIDKGQAILGIRRTTWVHDTPITTVKLYTKPDYKIVSR